MLVVVPQVSSESIAKMLKDADSRMQMTSYVALDEEQRIRFYNDIAKRKLH